MVNPALSELLVKNELLFEALADQLIKRPGPNIFIPGSDQPYTREVVLTEIKKWAQHTYPDVFPSLYFSQKDYSDQRFLNELLQLDTAKKEAEQAYEQARSIPELEKLKAWQKALELHENSLLREVSEVKDPTSLRQLAKLNLEQQIALLQSCRQNIEAQVIPLLPKHLSLEEKLKIGRQISQALARDSLLQQEGVDEEFIADAIRNLARQNPEVSVALPAPARRALAKTVSQTISDQPGVPAPFPPSQLLAVQQTIDQAKLLIAPSYEESKTRLEDKVKETLRVSDKAAQEFVWRFEAQVSQKPLPTQSEIAKAVQASLRPADYNRIGRQRKTVDDVTAGLAFTAEIHQTNLILAQQSPEYLSTVARNIKWVRKLNKQGVKINSVTLDCLLKGLTAEEVKSQVEEGLAIKLTDFKDKPQELEALLKTQPRYQKQYQLYQELSKVELKRLPRGLRLKIIKAQEKALLAGFLEKANPLAWKFWQYWLPSGARYIEEKIDLFKRTGFFLQASKFFDMSNGFKKRLAEKRFEKWKAKQLKLYQHRVTRWRNWGSFATKFSNLGFIARNPEFRRRVRSFLFHLPKNLQFPSFRKIVFDPIWKQLRGKVGNFITNIGLKVGVKKALGFALNEVGGIIAKEGFKKGIAFLLGSALGISTAGAGAVLAIIGTALSAVWTGIKYLLFSEAGREITKKVATLAVAGATAVIQFVLNLIAQFHFTIIGALLGGALGFAIGGPMGALLGAGIGGFIGNLIGPKIASFLGTAGLTAGGGAGLSLAPAVPAAMPGLFAGAGAAVAVPGTIFGVWLFTLFNSFVTNSAFVIPENYAKPFIEEEESAYIAVTKTANYQHLTNNELPQNITYTVSISAKEEKITNINILNSTTVTSINSVFSVDKDNQGNSITSFSAPTELNPGQNWSINYTISADQKFQDARITDTVNVSADVPVRGISGESEQDIAEVTIGTPPGAPIFTCPNAGSEVTLTAGNYPVDKILLTQGRPGGCIKPSMVVIHWSGSWTDNDTTRRTLEQRNRSCHIGTDQNGSVQQWQQLWENMAELAWCVGGDYNLYAVNNEMVGAWFDTNPPPEAEIDSAVKSTCWYLKQYNISVDQIWGHYALLNGKSDPGEEFLNKVFIPRVKETCNQ